MIRELKEKKNTIREFTLLFDGRYLLIEEERISLGQCSTDILNLDDAAIYKMNVARNEWIRVIQNLFESNVVPTREVIVDAQRKFDTMLGIINALPPYKYFEDSSFGNNMLLDLFEQQPNDLDILFNKHTKEGQAIFNFFFLLIANIDSIFAFKQYFGIMTDIHLEKLKKRNAGGYAIGVYQFFKDEETQKAIAEHLPKHSIFQFQQQINVSIEYTPMYAPDDSFDYVLVERIVFRELEAFLYMDFFRGLMHGHAPRKCHNCGTYFLLEAGYNSCYCTNPILDEVGEEIRTCRDVGAHKKEATKKGNRTPEQKEYDKVYNRLKTRKNRGSMSEMEYRKGMKLAKEYLEQQQKGVLSESEYFVLMKKF